ncbi:MAG TPA: hypothetical protein VJ505_11810 [Holophagaceae bacterium]|nr:hypothetical protein [Holophagaceae bacterium]
MTFNSVETRLAILVVGNAPVLVILGSMFFSSWSEFFSAFIPDFEFGFWSWVLDSHTRINWDNLKLGLFLMLSALLLAGEYRFFWPTPEAQDPKPKFNLQAMGAPDPQRAAMPPLRGSAGASAS